MARTVLRWQNGVIDFDAVESEAPEHEVTLTEYPVELGSNLVDHIRVMPVRFRMTVILSNSPSRDGVKSGMDGAAPTRGVDVTARKTSGSPDPRGQSVLVRKNLVPGLGSIAGVALERDTRITADAYLLGGQEGASINRDSVVRADVRVWGGGVSPIKRITSVYSELRTAMTEARLFTIVCDLGDFDNMVLKRISPQRTAANAKAPKFDLEFQQLLTATLIERDISALLPKRQRSKPAKDSGAQQVEPVAEAPIRKRSALSRWLGSDEATP